MAAPDKTGTRLLFFLWQYRTNESYREKINKAGGGDDDFWTRERYFETLVKRLPDNLATKVNKIPYRSPISKDQALKEIIPLIDAIYNNNTALARVSRAQPPTPIITKIPPLKPLTSPITPPPPLPQQNKTAGPVQQSPVQRTPEIIRVSKEPTETTTSSPASSQPTTTVSVSEPQPTTEVKPSVSPAQPGRISQTKPTDSYREPSLRPSTRGSQTPSQTPPHTSPTPSSRSPRPRTSNLGSQPSNPLDSLLNNLSRKPRNRPRPNSPRRLSNQVKKAVPWLIWLIIILLALILIGSLIGLFGTPTTENSQLTIKKTGDTAVDNGVDNGTEINYQITVTYTGSGTANAKITDSLPKEVSFISASDGGSEQPPGSSTVIWNLTNLQPNLNKILTLKVKVRDEFKDFWAVNKASATVTGTIGIQTTTNSGLLPNPLPPPTEDWAAKKQVILAAVNQFPENIAAYKEASSITGIPWEALAGLHYVETGSNPNPTKSLVSGRPIGGVEPDVPITLCSKAVSEPGTPISTGEGCGFATLLDSAIYAGKHLTGKIDKPPQNFEDFVTAMSLYNGGGNSNCDEEVPYSNDTNCPNKRVKEINSVPVTLRAPLFKGEDDPYAVAFFDQKHEGMYLVFCADSRRCSPLQPFTRPGAMAVVRALIEK